MKVDHDLILVEAALLALIGVSVLGRSPILVTAGTDYTCDEVLRPQRSLELI